MPTIPVILAQTLIASPTVSYTGRQLNDSTLSYVCRVYTQTGTTPATATMLSSSTGSSQLIRSDITMSPLPSQTVNTSNVREPGTLTYPDEPVKRFSGTYENGVLTSSSYGRWTGDNGTVLTVNPIQVVATLLDPVTRDAAIANAITAQITLTYQSRAVMWDGAVHHEGFPTLELLINGIISNLPVSTTINSTSSSNRTDASGNAHTEGQRVSTHVGTFTVPINTQVQMRYTNVYGEYS